MDAAAARALAATAAQVGARLLLVRRPAGCPPEDGRWVFAVDSRPGREQVLARHLDDDAIEPTTGITFDQLVAEYGVRIPDIVEQLNEEATP